VVKQKKTAQAKEEGQGEESAKASDEMATRLKKAIAKNPKLSAKLKKVISECST